MNVPGYNKTARFLGNAYVISIVAQLVLLFVAVVWIVASEVQHRHRFGFAIATGYLVVAAVAGLLRMLMKAWFRRRWPLGETRRLGPYYKRMQHK